MFILIVRDDFFGLEIIQDSHGKPKQFKSEDEAYFYAKEMGLSPFQSVEVSI